MGFKACFLLVPPRVAVLPKSRVQLGQPNVLICIVDNIFPPVINVSWLRNGQPVTQGATQTGFYAQPDHSFRKFHYLTFVPLADDFYACKVEHWGLDQPHFQHWGMRPPPGHPPQIHASFTLSPSAGPPDPPFLSQSPRCPPRCLTPQGLWSVPSAWPSAWGASSWASPSSSQARACPAPPGAPGAWGEEGGDSAQDGGGGREIRGGEGVRFEGGGQRKEGPRIVSLNLDHVVFATLGDGPPERNKCETPFSFLASF